MKKVTLEDFKNDKVFLIITVFLGILAGAFALMKPSQDYFGEREAFLISILTQPIFALWFYYFWNKILAKIINLKQISYPVALILTFCLTILLY